MANLPSLTSLILNLRGLTPKNEMEERFLAFTHEVPKAVHQTITNDLLRLIVGDVFSSLTNKTLAAFIAQNGLPFPETGKALWLDTPSSVGSKGQHTGYLFRISDDKKRVSIKDIICRYADEADTRIKTTSRELSPASLYLKKYNAIIDYPCVTRHIEFHASSPEPFSYTSEGVDELKKEVVNALEKISGHTPPDMMEKIKRDEVGQSNRVLRHTIRLLALMTHEQIWRQENGLSSIKNAAKKQKSGIAQVHPALSADYLAALRNITSPEEMVTFLGLDKTAHVLKPTVADLVADAVTHTIGANDSNLIPFNIVLNNLPQATILRYDQSVFELTQKVVREIPAKDIDRMFKEAGLQSCKIWIEGPYTSPEIVTHAADMKDYTSTRIGGLFQRFNGGYEYTSVMIWKLADPFTPKTGLKNRNYRITGEHWSIDDEAPYPETSALPAIGEQAKIGGPLALHTFLKTLLLLERAKTEILQDAGLLPKPKQDTEKKAATKPEDGDPSIRRARIYAGKPAKDKTVRIDLTKPPRRLSSERPEYVITDDKLTEWETQKKNLRQTIEDELEYICKFPEDPASQKALLDIEKQFSATAKAVFEDDVTARLTFVPQSKSFWSHKKGGYQHISAHVRSFLYREYTDPSERSLFTAARDLTATRETVSVRQDPHGAPVLILTVNG